jgi:GNAT superfamily N-acetyltransferase
MLVIRNIEYKDLKSVINLTRVTLSNFEPNASDYSKIWSTFNSQSNVFGFVGVMDSSVLVYCSLLAESKIRGGCVGYIQDFAVIPSHQKRGLGSEMFKFVEKFALDLGCYKLVLSTKVENQEFYEKNGFSAHEISMLKRLTRK